MSWQPQQENHGEQIPDESFQAIDRLLLAVGVGTLMLAMLLLVLSGWAIFTAAMS